jgi:peroxiredoxin Q/BCP
MIKTIYFFLFSFLISSCGGSANILKVGEDAPDFTLQDVNDISYTLSDYKGKSPVIIYFYPKASTPGCTKQACGVRDEYSKFEEKGIIIFGISVDPKEDIKEFRDDYNLNFPLLSDEDKKVSSSYGVLNNIGFSNRVTFIVDKERKLSHIIKDVDVDNHASDIFEIAKKL